MNSLGEKWYKDCWSLDIKNQSWVEDTINQVDFLIKALNLNGNERILDLACGYGRHALEFAKRGYSVVGVDITSDFIDDANKNATAQNLDAKFYCSDIREVKFADEFDVVLNMADGAVGYLENETENLKIFDVVASALRSGGKHFMDIMSADYADTHYPLKLWDSGSKSITLSTFEWDKKTRILMYGQNDFMYGQTLEKFEIWGNPTRLYGEEEVCGLLAERGLKVFATYSDYYGAPASQNGIQLMVCSEKL